jgi:hypothetical protein
VCALFEGRLTRLIRIGQHRRVDVDDHLVALTRRAGIELVMESRLREQRQGIRLLLGHGRRVARRFTLALGSRPLVQRLARCRDRLYEQRPHLWIEPPPQHHHAVLVLVDV